jgi:hypothetical protein
VTLNITAVDQRADGYLSVAPCGSEAGVSNVNHVSGHTTAKAVAVATIGDEGPADLCVSTFAETDIVVDVTGWFGLPGALAGGRLAPVRPARLIVANLAFVPLASTARSAS